MRPVYTEEELKELAEVRGVVFDIEHFSIHDGPGIRTVVFLKGCPLHCAWCANPESNKFGPQVGLFEDKCTFCKKCADVCPYGDVFVNEHRVAWESCISCMKCVDACLYDARVTYGKIMTAAEVVKQVKKDRVFFANSGGGVTLSGGEVCSQPEFAVAVLALCQAEGIHTAIETSAFATWTNYEKIVRHLDLLLQDIKNMDNVLHKKYTGVEKTRILENSSLASEIAAEMIVRWPVIPGFNDSVENAQKLSAFMNQKMPKVKRVDLLPYHTAGKSKCERIGREYGYEAPYELTDEHVEELQKILTDAGLDARIGG